MTKGTHGEHEDVRQAGADDGDWVHVSGTTGFDYTTMTISEDVVEQAEQCLRNIEAALTEAGAGFADVVRVRYLLPDRADFEPCWPVLRARFGQVRPMVVPFIPGTNALWDPWHGSHNGKGLTEDAFDNATKVILNQDFTSGLTQPSSLLDYFPYLAPPPAS